MTELVEDQNLSFDHRDGVVVARRRTFSASCAGRRIPDRFEYGDILVLREHGFHEEMIVRLLHIAIEQTNLTSLLYRFLQLTLRQRIREVHRKRRFPCPPFSTGDCDRHFILLTSSVKKAGASTKPAVEHFIWTLEIVRPAKAFSRFPSSFMHQLLCSLHAKSILPAYISHKPFMIRVI